MRQRTFADAGFEYLRKPSRRDGADDSVAGPDQGDQVALPQAEIKSRKTP